MAISDWQDFALCKDDSKFQDFPLEYDERAINYSKSVCERCPVQLECLAKAYVRREREGIWGGYLYKERITLFAFLGIPSSISWGDLVDKVLAPRQHKTRIRKRTSYRSRLDESLNLDELRFSDSCLFQQESDTQPFAEILRLVIVF